ncbi:hypothetical protein K492DRAFT_208776 [Lichtheimia hyalospora FSU 10163]|nr:hypothetical protein K492DRAFT_208776 [Lichtheimia hyalospora FSU 10163]
MVMPITPCNRSLTDIPIDVIATIASQLDVCSLWNLLDTCRYFRYNLLGYQSVWRRIVVDLDYCDLSSLYAALRRLRDSNGLRTMVKEVIMDGNDDAMISPIIMLVKFPQLRHLSTRHRRFNTNLEVDSKMIQELLKNGTLKPHSLALESVNVYHHYMSTEPHLDTFQRTLNRLSRNQYVQLDIRECDRTPLQQRATATTNSNHSTTTTTTSNNTIDYNSIIGLEQQPHISALVDSFQSINMKSCSRIIAKDACCWACGYNFDRCWQCVPVCGGCRKKRFPPLANANMMQSQHINPATTTSPSIENDATLEDEFRFFE